MTDPVKLARGIAAVWMLTALVTAPNLKLDTIIRTFNNLIEEAREKEESHIVRGYD